MFTKSRLFAVITAALLAPFSMAQAAGPIELVLHENEIFGARYIEDGQYEKGIERIMSRLEDSSDAYSWETPKLIALCAGYTMSGDTEAATDFCNQAVEQDWNQGLALNNRGALHFSMGNYDAAISDFQAALESVGATGEARRNLERAQLRLAQIQDSDFSNAVAAAQD